MKAVVCTAYGGPEVVQIAEVATPKPGPGEVLIKIHAASVSAADWRIRSRDAPLGFGLIVRLFFGWSRLHQPILGADFSGEVVELGAGVTRFAKGDMVMGAPGAQFGSHAEYKVMKETGALWPKPKSMTHVEATSIIFGGRTAAWYMRDKAQLRAGQTVLINGASGAVGSSAVQIAKHLGAEVTGICSGANTDLVRSLGADHVIDYTREDVCNLGKRYDVVMDCVGNLPYARATLVLTPKGQFLPVVADLPQMLGAVLRAPFSKRTTILGSTPDTAKGLAELVKLVEAAALRPVIERVYPLEEARAAHAHVGSGRKKGTVVLTFDGTPS